MIFFLKGSSVIRDLRDLMDDDPATRVFCFCVLYLFVVFITFPWLILGGGYN